MCCATAQAGEMWFGSGTGAMRAREWRKRQESHSGRPKREWVLLPDRPASGAMVGDRNHDCRWTKTWVHVCPTSHCSLALVVT